ncbi:MAG: hypothetical protein ACFB0B_21110 [Thermonemataceae bacterium]
MNYTEDTNFKIYEPTTEVKGSIIMSLIDAMDEYQAIGLAYLNKYDIDKPEPEKWYKLSSYLSALRLIYEKLGESTLYLIGARIYRNVFPKEYTEKMSLEEILNSVNDVYHSIHRNGDIGHVKYTATSETSCTMEVHKTYGTPLDRGLFVSLTRMFQPKQRSSLDTEISVELDELLPNRKTGSDTEYFHISW